MGQKLGILCRISNVHRVQALTMCTNRGDVTDPSKQPALKLRLSSFLKNITVPQRVLVISTQEDYCSYESIFSPVRNTGETVGSIFKHNSHINTISCILGEKNPHPPNTKPSGK